MTPQKIRMIKALQHLKPDKIPHGEVFIHDLLVEKLTGTPMPWSHKNSMLHWAYDWLSDIEFNAHLNSRYLLGCDFVVVFPGWKLENLGERNGYPLIKDIWGRIFLSSPETTDVIYHPIQSVDDFVHYHFPPPKNFFWDNIARWKEQSPLFTACQIDIGFSMMVELIGFERLVFSLKDERSKLFTFIKNFHDFASEMVDMAIEKGADCIWLADDFAHNLGTFISPKDLLETDFQYIDLLTKRAHRRGLPVNLHACGRITDVIDSLISTGIDSLMGIQPAAGNNIYELHSKYHNHLTFIGNLDLNELLTFGSPLEVNQVVQELCEKCGEFGSFILSSCNSLTEAVSIENALTAHLACEKYGKPFFINK